MEQCTIQECENSVDEENTQCEECKELTNKLNSIWKEKTKEIIIEDDDL